MVALGSRLISVTVTNDPIHCFYVMQKSTSQENMKVIDCDKVENDEEVTLKSIFNFK